MSELGEFIIDDPLCPRLTLVYPGDASRFYVGMRVEFASRMPWWRRAWRWFLRAVLRRKPRPGAALTVVGVDYQNGVLEVGVVP